MKFLLFRKIIHILFGISAITLLYKLPQFSRYFLGSAAVFSFIFDLWRRREGRWKNLFYRIFNKLLKPSESSGQLSGATTFLITVAVLPFLFAQNVAVVSILILSISDPMASIAGRLQPLKKIRKEKSLMGSATFFISASIILQLFLPQSIIYILITALLTTLVELLAPEVIENIVIGFSAALLVAPII
jgi:dolichol kinase